MDKSYVLYYPWQEVIIYVSPVEVLQMGSKSNQAINVLFRSWSRDQDQI